MQARVTSSSQVERLRERMEQAEVRHGQGDPGRPPRIRVIGLARNWFTPREQQKGDVLFCTMGPVRVRQVTIPGDERPLPTNVIVEGLVVPSSGTYDLLDALVQSNGDLRLIVDEATKVVPVAPEREPVWS